MLMLYLWTRNSSQFSGNNVVSGKNTELCLDPFNRSCICLSKTMHTFESNISNVPAFLVKLWNIVEDPSCDEIIAWSDSGTSFIIKDPTRISKEILQHYFKHSNMASFIRQLNMYGFRKVMNYEKSGLNNESSEMEFQHSFFSKGHVELLEHIKRKIPNTRVSEPAKSNARDILTDLSSIREKQENMDNMLIKMKQENELLWRELTNMRKKHKAQEHVIQKVIQFLVSIVQRSNQTVGVQRKIPRMLHDSSNNKRKSQVQVGLIDVINKKSSYLTAPQANLVSPLGPVIHEVTDFEHENEGVPLSPMVKSPEDGVEKSADSIEPVPVCPIDTSLNSSVNAPVTMEPLNILEQSTSVMNSGKCAEEESVLGLPFEYMNAPPSNVLSLPEIESCDNIISLPDTTSDMCLDFPSSDVIVYSSNLKSDFDDSMSESLQTPNIPTIHIEDVPSPHAQPGKKSKTAKKKSFKTANEEQSKEQNNKITLSDSSSLSQSQALMKNSLSNHVITTEEELDGLFQDGLFQDLLSEQFNFDKDNILELFSTDAVANHEILAGESTVANIKTEPVDIVGNELVQFCPSILGFDSESGNNHLLQCLGEDAEVPVDIIKNSANSKDFAHIIDQTDELAASEDTKYLMKNESSTKQKCIRPQKIQRSQKAKRRKIK